jgi:glutaredoxin
MKNVVLYTKSECVFCNNEEIKEKYPTQKTFPVVLINEEFIGGYTELFDRLRGKDE